MALGKIHASALLAADGKAWVYVVLEEARTGSTVVSDLMPAGDADGMAETLIKAAREAHRMAADAARRSEAPQ